MAKTAGVATISGNEAEQVERANATGLQPVVFVHGLWLLPNSWERWASYFEDEGYVALAPAWPDDRGPLLIVAAEKDHTVPMAVSKAAFDQQKRNIDLTEYVEMPGRGHALTIDHGWQDVANTALKFIRRFV